VGRCFTPLTPILRAFALEKKRKSQIARRILPRKKIQNNAKTHENDEKREEMDAIVLELLLLKSQKKEKICSDQLVIEYSKTFINLVFTGTITLFFCT